MPLRVGLVGAGHMGKIHARKLTQIEGIRLAGVADSRKEVAAEASKEFATTPFTDFMDLLDTVDGIVIATPTETHHVIARSALQKGKHVFLEKPMTSTPDEADELIKLAHRKGVVLQVGHLERFNPAFTQALLAVDDPIFIEAHRISPYTGRSTDVDVVYDLMIHDIDLVLSIAKGEVSEIRALGTPVVSDKTDIANARIEFSGGCVANLTASRISVKRERKFRIFQKDRYLSVDLMNGKLVSAVKTGTNSIETTEYSAEQIDPVKDELLDFVHSMAGRKRPTVRGEHGLQAIILANRICESIEEHLAQRR